MTEMREMRTQDAYLAIWALAVHGREVKVAEK